MVLGILSDTHDTADAMTVAVALLQSRGAEFFIHCGDVGSTRILDCLAGLRGALFTKAILRDAFQNLLPPEVAQ